MEDHKLEAVVTNTSDQAKQVVIGRLEEAVQLLKQGGEVVDGGIFIVIEDGTFSIVSDLRMKIE